MNNNLLAVDEEGQMLWRRGKSLELLPSEVFALLCSAQSALGGGGGVGQSADSAALI